MKNALLAGLAAAVVAAATLHADTISKTIKWDNEKWLPVGLASEGVEIKEIRFAVEGGIHWNPLRAGTGPQAFVQIKNTSGHEMKLAVAVALFDEKGGLVGATESANIGKLDADENKEIKMTFRDVKRRFFDAKTAQIALETYR